MKRTFDLYSKRLRRSQQTEPDVYQFDNLPPVLRGQIERIWDEAIGPYVEPHANAFEFEDPPQNNGGWETIRDLVCRERGSRTGSAASLAGSRHIESSGE